jgi:DNA-nicking Smr family endonuclease
VRLPAFFAWQGPRAADRKLWSHALSFCDSGDLLWQANEPRLFLPAICLSDGRKTDVTMTRETLRPLSDEEIMLWLTVTRSIARRPGAAIPELPRPKPEKAGKVLPPTGDGAASGTAKLESKPKSAPLAALPGLAPLERRARQKLARGHLPVDAALDLHGLRQHEAHPALHGFLLRAQRHGAKIVLVVTGKGERRISDAFEEGGVLRRAVPIWLRAPEWRNLVVGFEEAARHHGGAGALYVRIRRRERT